MTREDKRIEETNSAAEYFIAGPLCEEKFTEEQEDFVMYCFAEGAKWADNNPKTPWISVEDDLPCNHEELTHSNYTDRVIVLARNEFPEVEFMYKVEEGVWEWTTLKNVSYWMPIPKLPE